MPDRCRGAAMKGQKTPPMTTQSTSTQARNWRDLIRPRPLIREGPGRAHGLLRQVRLRAAERGFGITDRQLAAPRVPLVAPGRGDHDGAHRRRVPRVHDDRRREGGRRHHPQPQGGGVPGRGRATPAHREGGPGAVPRGGRPHGRRGGHPVLNPEAAHRHGVARGKLDGAHGRHGPRFVPPSATRTRRSPSAGSRSTASSRRCAR